VSSTAEDLHQAIADVLQAHGYGMVSRLAFVVELVDEETGGLGLMRGTTPNDLPAWSELGLLQYAITDIQASVTAAQVAANEEDG
jgi:hypothetical protein